jgi:hypothetical protein
MAQPYRNIGSIEASAALSSLAAGGNAAYMDFDSTSSLARFGAKGGPASSVGVAIRTLVSGIALNALVFAPNMAATFGADVTMGSLNATDATFADVVRIAGGSGNAAPGTLSRQLNIGLTLVGIAGAQLDFSLLRPSDFGLVMGVFTGTLDVTFQGTVRNDAAPGGFALGNVGGVQRVAFDPATNGFGILQASDAYANLFAHSATFDGAVFVRYTTPSVNILDVNRSVHNGGLLQLGGRNSTGGERVWASLQADCTSVTPGAEAADLIFATMRSGTLTQTARLTTLGVFSATSIITSNPSGGSAAAWKMGSVSATTGLVLSTTSYVQLDIAGTPVKLAIVS